MYPTKSKVTSTPDQSAGKLLRIQTVIKLHKEEEAIARSGPDLATYRSLIAKIEAILGE